MKSTSPFIQIILSLVCFSSKAAPPCPYEATPVCAIPKRCQYSELGGGKIPFECDVGVSYKSRCGVKPDEFLYQYEGRCEKPKPKSRVQILMKDAETCSKPVISGARAVEFAIKAGLKPPVTGSILAEYSEGSFYPEKPFPGCLWSLRVSVETGSDLDQIEVKEDVYFVHPVTGVTEYQNPKKPKKKK